MRIDSNGQRSEEKANVFEAYREREQVIQSKISSMTVLGGLMSGAPLQPQESHHPTIEKIVLNKEW
jgi:hypothetical protein